MANTDRVLLDSELQEVKLPASELVLQARALFTHFQLKIHNTAGQVILACDLMMLRPFLTFISDNNCIATKLSLEQKRSVMAASPRIIFYARFLNGKPGDSLSFKLMNGSEEVSLNFSTQILPSSPMYQLVACFFQQFLKQPRES